MLALLLESAGFGEWFMLLAVVLIVVGPQKLPSAARKIGSYYAKFRRAAESFKRQILDMETEITRTVESAEQEVNEAFKVEGDEASADPGPVEPDMGVPPDEPPAEPSPVEPNPAEPSAGESAPKEA